MVVIKIFNARRRINTNQIRPDEDNAVPHLSKEGEFSSVIYELPRNERADRNLSPVFLEHVVLPLIWGFALIPTLPNRSA